MIPSLTSEKANTASGAATAMSAQATRPAPPPSAWPCTRHTTGAGQRSTDSSRCRSAFASRRFALVVELGGGAHPLHVGARAEARALAREHDRADAADVHEHLGELRDQRRVERVAPLGPREGDPQDLAVALDLQGGHVRSLPSSFGRFTHA